MGDYVIQKIEILDVYKMISIVLVMEVVKNIIGINFIIIIINNYIITKIKITLIIHGFRNYYLICCEKKYRQSETLKYI
jgi:hypothetical protein